MTQYQHYAVTPGSPAHEHVEAFRESFRVRNKAAMKFARKYIGENALPWGSDVCIFGFSPEKGNFEDFCKALPGGMDEWVRPQKTERWVRPREIRKPTEEQAARCTAFEAIPRAMSNETLCKQLFGVGMWFAEHHMYQMTHHFSKTAMVVGIPWGAARNQKPFDDAKNPVKPCKGLKRISYETAHRMMAEGK